MPQVQTPFGPGSTITGRYEVEKILGAGGMGQVVKAIDQTLDNEGVALKMLYTHLVKDPVTFARFRNEVLVTRQLSHPNIVKIFDFGKASDEVYFISMELVSGQSLGRMIADSRRKPIPFQEMLRILIEVGKGVSHAHSKGIVHRDLKPDNILVGDNGDVKVTDFGLARTVHIDKGFTNTGEAVGTPYYMAPEQVRGDEVDSRCDIYALGIIMFELATGRRPFEDDAWFNLAAMHLREPLPSFASKESGIPRWYEKIAQRAAAKREDDRYDSVDDLVEELEKHLDDQPVRIKRQSAINALYNKPSKRRSPMRERIGWALIAGLVVLMAVFVIRFTPVIKQVLSGAVLKTEQATGSDLAPVKAVIGAGSVNLSPAEFFNAIRAGNVDALAALIEAGIDPKIKNEMGETGVVVAVKSGKSNVLSKLLELRADIDATDGSGKTALMHALESDNNAIIFELIDAGAEVNMRDKQGRSPLIYAVINNKLPVITALRKRGALINSADFDGQTALQYAVSQNATSIVRVLLEDGEETADPNIADAAGNTPLFTAAAHGSTEIVKQLVTHGAKMKVVNLKGVSPYQVATKAVKDLMNKYDYPSSRAADVITVRGEARPENSEKPNPLKTGPKAAEPAAGGKPEAGAASAQKMTRLRVSGKPVGTWKLGKKGAKIGNITATVRNVGDYPASGVVVTAVIPGGSKVKMTGPDKLERNEAVEYSISDEQSAAASGELKTELTCDNCYR